MSLRLGVVTVTYNSAGVLHHFLECLRAQDLPAGAFRTYVVDNASTDTTLEMLRAGDTSVCIFPNADNRGFAAASNQGIRHALADGCEFVLLLNNDTSFDPTLFRDLLAVADRIDARVLTPRIDREDSPSEYWYAGGGIRQWRAFTPTLPRPEDSESGHHPVRFASGCCLLIRQDVIYQVGLLDEDFFVYCEDMDFCLRLKHHHIPIDYVPSIRMRHKVGNSTGGHASAFSVSERMRNQVILLRKHAKVLHRLVGLSYLQAWMIVRFVVRRDDATTLRRRQRAFASGLRPGLTAPEAPQIGDLDGVL